MYQVVLRDAFSDKNNNCDWSVLVLVFFFVLPFRKIRKMTRHFVYGYILIFMIQINS